MLNLEHRLVGQHFGDEFSVEGDLIVGGSIGGDLIEEFAEIVADRQINEHLLVECRVVITIDRLHVFELWEIAERVSVAHKILNWAVRLETLDNVNDVLNLIAMEHASEELVERVGALANEVLNLSHQLLFHVHAEQLYVESIFALALENC